LEVRELRECVARQRRFVGQDDMSAAGAFDNLRRRRAIVHRQIAQGGDLVPRIVAGVEGMAVEYHDAHWEISEQSQAQGRARLRLKKLCEANVSQQWLTD